MVFLRLIELEKTQFDLLKNNLFSFLSFEKLYHADVMYLKWFLYKNHKNITVDDCKKLLEISCKDVYTYEKDDILNLIAEICFQNKYQIVDDIEYAKKLLSNFEYQDRYSDSIVYLWIISNEKIKNFYYQTIIERLENDFDDELYKSATANKIIDYNSFFDSFISYLNRINKDNDTEKDGYFLEDGKPKFHNHLFHNDLLFLYRLKVKGNDQRLQHLNNLYEFMKFCIFREKYDISKFKIEWLYLFDHEIFYNEFKKIKALKKIIENSLKENYDEELALIYTKYFL